MKRSKAMRTVHVFVSVPLDSKNRHTCTLSLLIAHRHVTCIVKYTCYKIRIYVLSLMGD